MAVPYTFGSATTSIPLSQLDSNFATTITLGNTAIQLGNTVTTLNNMTLANVTISSGTSNLAATAISNGTSNVTIASSGGNISMATNGTTAITVDTAQNVGIGTASPSTMLNLSRDSGLSTGTGTTIALRLADTSSDGGANTWNTTQQFTAVQFYSADASGPSGASVRASVGATMESTIGGLAALTFFTNNSGTPTERMRIDSSGNLLVGATSEPNASVAGVKICSPTVAYSRFSAGNNNSEFYQIGFLNGNGLIGRISTNGSSTSYVTSSDYRLKHDIQPMTGALTKIAQIKPVTYKWNADNSASQGFIAHELQEVVPECVSGEKDAVDADGNPKYQGIDTSFLVATLTAAIQELKAINDTQTETINALTARIVALESK